MYRTLSAIHDPSHPWQVPPQKHQTMLKQVHSLFHEPDFRTRSKTHGQTFDSVCCSEKLESSGATSARVRLWTVRMNKSEPTVYLEAVGSIRGVLGRFPRVELGVAAEEESLQFAADGRTVTAAVIFNHRQHATTLSVSGAIRGAVQNTQGVKTQIPGGHTHTHTHTHTHLSCWKYSCCWFL